MGKRIDACKRIGSGNVDDLSDDGRDFMLRRMIHLAMVLLILGSALAGTAGITRAWDEPTHVANVTIMNSVSSLETDGQYLVWILYHSQGSPASMSSKVDGVDRATGEPVTIDLGWDEFDSGGAAWAPLIVDLEIDNGLLAVSSSWNRYYPTGPQGVFARNLPTGEQWQLSSGAGPVSVSGSTVYWAEHSPNDDRDVILMQDVADPDATPARLFTAATATTSIVDLSVTDGSIVFQEHEQSTDHWRLKVLGDEPVTLAESGERIAHDLAGDALVYREAGGLTIRNLSTGTTQRLPIDTPHFAFDGRYIVWTTGTTIDAYDLQTTASFHAVVPGPNDDPAARFDLVALSGGTLAWTRLLPFEWPAPTEPITSEIHATDLTERLPSSFRPSPPGSDPDWMYFPETGHYLAHGFRDYWESNGSLSVFGYPLTEEFIERNVDTDLDHAVQITERQRFEWHPENAAPYHVLLGRLGAELLTSQGRDWTMLPTADPSAPHYMAVTQHAIDERFWAYWSSHGLDFGDPDASFRESLALFGYPLSEPMLETNADGDTVLTQYFERAVFEYHPDNAAPYDVLLRRLGWEVLVARGWGPGHLEQ